MKITYYMNGELRTAHPTTTADLIQFVGILERAGGYLADALR